jgi:hypothetical protein
VPYGLYRAHGFFNPHFAKRTGVDAADLEIFWQALQSMWDVDRSASRGMMSCRGLYVFSHESNLGNAPAQDLFARVHTPPSEAPAPRSSPTTNRDRRARCGVTLTLVGDGAESEGAGGELDGPIAVSASSTMRTARGSARLIRRPGVRWLHRAWDAGARRVDIPVRARSGVRQARAADLVGTPRPHRQADLVEFRPEGRSCRV